MQDQTQFETKLKGLHEKLRALSDYQKTNKLQFTFSETGPYRRELYKKHCAFFEAGSKHRFRLLSGGNGSGKSFALAYEVAVHATGLYPSWWKGKKFKKLTTIWLVAKSKELFRDSLQKTLFGNPGEPLGTGLIPAADKHEKGVGVLQTNSAQGVPNVIGSALIQHADGHTVSVVLKTFDMDRENLQAANVGLLAFDEEPPQDVYEECVMRTRGTKTTESGIVMMAFTPLLGLTSVVLDYLPNGMFPDGGIHPTKPTHYAVRIGWDEAPHLTEEDKEAMLSSISPNLRDARTKGIPALGSGRVYPIHEEDIVVNFLKIGTHWPRAFGMDFGWNRTAVVWGAKDPTTGVLYIYGEYYQGEKAPYVHAHAIKERGFWIPGICDPRGDKSSERDGSKLIDEYRALGLELIPGDNSIQSGVARVLNMMESGLLKVVYNNEKWLEEFRVYRYDTKDPNKIAKNQNDHLMDATRYLVSMFDAVAISSQEAQQALDPPPVNRFDNNRNDVTGY